MRSTIVQSYTGLALGVLGVDVGAAPLQRGRAVAGGEQVVRAEVDRLRRSSSPSSPSSFAPSFM